jgi:hypothetical protein
LDEIWPPDAEDPYEPFSFPPKVIKYELPPRTYVFPRINSSQLKSSPKIGAIESIVHEVITNSFTEIDYFPILFEKSDVSIILKPHESVDGQIVLTDNGLEIHIYVNLNYSLDDIRIGFKVALRHETLHGLMALAANQFYKNIPEIEKYKSDRFFKGKIAIENTVPSSAYIRNDDMFKKLKIAVCKGHKRIFEIPDLLRGKNEKKLSQNNIFLLNKYYQAAKNFQPERKFLQTNDAKKNLVELLEKGPAILHLPLPKSSSIRYLLAFNIQMQGSGHLISYYITNPNHEDNKLETLIDSIRSILFNVENAYQKDLSIAITQKVDPLRFLWTEIHANLVALLGPMIDIFYPELAQFNTNLLQTSFAQPAVPTQNYKPS